MESLEKYFQPFRNNIIGNEAEFQSPFGTKKIVYCDWTASGRLYRPIEEKIINELGPYVGNTHTETSVTGTLMTQAYHQAREIIKKHVNASKEDVIIASGSGMTSVINKFQRILGLRIPERLAGKISLPEEERPIVFVTHMEHHSNQTSWLETIAEVVHMEPNDAGVVDTANLETLLGKYNSRKTKIAAVTACSNVTGIHTPYYEIAEIMHRNGGYCFVDFACSAPYVNMDMHPANPLQYLDAVYFSPHKFLGGPGTPGILVFNSKLYHNRVPDQPGGGTVKWTNPWNEHEYVDSVEDREDGGTPAFLQTIKAALCVKLKEEMGTKKMLAREDELLKIIFPALKKISGLHLLAGNIEHRLGVISFYIDGLHYNLGVKLLNDRYGIQVRGGCSCAGTYGHYLLNVTPGHSKMITNEIHNGNLSLKPGWIRLSVHPVMTDREAHLAVDAIRELSENFREWGKEYEYSPVTNEFTHRAEKNRGNNMVMNWFGTLQPA
jgi:selenocysteine lyase/cysteine desulfurase